VDPRASTTKQSDSNMHPDQRSNIEQDKLSDSDGSNQDTPGSVVRGLSAKRRVLTQDQRIDQVPVQAIQFIKESEQARKTWQLN